MSKTLTGGIAALCLLPATAGAVDWNAVPAKQVVLFHPGQTSWEYLLVTAEHSGAPRFREGKTCFQCHYDEPAQQGPLLASGRKNEPTPHPEQPPTVDARVRFAIENDSLLVQVRFAEGEQTDLRMDADFASKFSMMVGDARQQEIARAGCWIACHDDSASMPSAGKSDRSKYLPRTRATLARTGGGDALKPADDLARLRSDGYVLEYWQARLNPGMPVQAAGGVIFDRRSEVKPSQVKAEAVLEDGVWTVVLSRPLSASPMLELVPGRPYRVGFALHAGHTARRFHYVSYEYSLTLEGGQAEFVALRQ